MTTTLTRPDFTAADRCDRCGAAAMVRAVLPSGSELLFCGHHARLFEKKLIYRLMYLKDLRESALSRAGVAPNEAVWRRYAS